jgi:ribosome-binding protein aMBF1 (putative translation factor)
MLKMQIERIKKGLTFTDLSYHVKIHPSTLGKIESKKMIAYKPHKMKLSKFFNISAEELFQDISQDTKEVNKWNE